MKPIGKKWIALCFVLVTFIGAHVFALDAIVYIISGGPFKLSESPTDSYGTFLSLVQAQAPHSTLSLNRKHNSLQTEVCDDIIKLKTQNPEAKVIVAGHSYGADAGIWVSQCLSAQKIGVDLLLTMDTVPRDIFTTTASLTVPDNVKLNFHFYQDHDPLIQGAGYNRRSDNSERSIYNVMQNFGSVPMQAHLSVISHLNDYLVTPVLAAGIIQNLNETQLLAAVKPFQDKFFAAYPPENINYSIVK